MSNVLVLFGLAGNYFCLGVRWDYFWAILKKNSWGGVAFIMRYIYIGLGFIFLVVGIAGVILPLLPGTVNLLIAAFFFAKGSPRMESWLVNHRWLGPPIRNWRTDRSMTRKTKITAITMMWMGIGYSVYAAPLIGGVCSVLLGIYGTYYILKQRTQIEPVEVAEPEPAAARVLPESA